MTNNANSTRTSISTELQLAFRYGDKLPKPKQPALQAPAFWVGSCYGMTFSPSGERLVVPTANGCFLWNVDSCAKIARLKAITNPSRFSFSADGTLLLMRNEVSQFAWFDIVNGDFLGKVTPKYQFRLDGHGCLASDNHVVLQLAYDGNFLMFDARTGKVLFSRQLEPTGYDGQVYWLPDNQEVLVVQRSVQNRHGRGEPCAIWRWKWPLDRHEPVRLAGIWNHLASKLYREKRLLLLHHQPRDSAPGKGIIELMNLDELSRRSAFACASSVTASASISHDLEAWAVSDYNAIEIAVGDAHLRIPIKTGTAEFHPIRDLVAISGASGFVAPRGAIPALATHLQEVRDSEDLAQRGYSRGTNLPGRVLPPRIVVIRASTGRFIVQREVNVGMKYAPLADLLRVDSADDLITILDDHIAGKRTMPAIANAASDERRHFLGASITAPIDDALAIAAVAFASDAIEIWPMKSRGNGVFEYSWYPVAAFPPNSSGGEILRALQSMLNYYRPTKL